MAKPNAQDKTDGDPFWSVPAPEMLRRLRSSEKGLASDEAAERLASGARNLLAPKESAHSLALFASQFKSPITIILLIAVGISAGLGELTDAVIITSIILFSGLLGFWQERGAAHAVSELLAMVQVTADVLRDGQEKVVPVGEVVLGDIVVLSAGALVPGDSLLLESKDLFANEASLTGESFPADKAPGVLPKDTPLARRSNCLFMGTHVVSGNGRALVVSTGKSTVFGRVSERLKQRPQETDFERGVRRFGYLLMELTLVLVVAIFAINAWHGAGGGRSSITDALLFSLALAVGLTPQLLPAIISVNLSYGARKMAEKKVVVKRLVTIENFGSMNVLCSDKTGTLTEGTVKVRSGLDARGQESAKVLFLAGLNSYFVGGVPNMIDSALRSGCDSAGCALYKKLDEVPYDFIRKRLSVLVEKDGRAMMITKGALDNVLSVCTRGETATGDPVAISDVRAVIMQNYERLGEEGDRVLGVACIEDYPSKTMTRDSEKGMTFLGFVVFTDPPKNGVKKAIDDLAALGISFKMITGDNRLVARYIARTVGIADPQVLSGPEVAKMSPEALAHRVKAVDVFAEVEPNQKEAIILALRKATNVVGYMGDGINDAAAIHAADVGISVDDAVDVAKDAADIVLLEKDLDVLADGVREGRVTFANTMKYVFMATSANFGNMFSMAGASTFLSFLPLLPKQILLTNVMTDIPEMTIATDAVDPELTARPERWNIGFIRKFMLVFGILSSVFDFVTFGVLLLVLGASEGQFRTGWFLESIVSACLIVLVIRTRKPFVQSHPGKWLLGATLGIIAAAVVLPYTPAAGLFGFVRPEPVFLLMMLGIVGVYIISAEAVKHVFYKYSHA